MNHTYYGNLIAMSTKNIYIYIYDEQFFVAAGGVSKAQQHGYRTTHSIA